MVAGVFAVVASAIAETALVGLDQKRIEGLVLARANVQAAQLETDYPLQPFHGVLFFTGCHQLGACVGPKIHNALDGRARLENLDGQGNVRNVQAFHKVHCELLGYVAQNSLLLVQHLLVIAEQAAIPLILQSLQNFMFTHRELFHHRFLAEIQRWWTLIVILITHISKRIWACRNMTFPRQFSCRYFIINLYFFIGV